MKVFFLLFALSFGTGYFNGVQAQSELSEEELSYWSDFLDDFNEELEDWHDIDDQKSVKRADFSSRRTAGYYMGRPIKSSSSKGIVFKSKEVEVNLGQVPGDSNYVGQTFAMSIEDRDVFKDFERAEESGNAYIFQYERPMWFNPEIEKTMKHILEIQPLLSASDFENSGLPNKVSTIKGPGRGHYSEGSRRGRIVGVHRIGFMEPYAVVTLSMSGIKTESDGGAGENTAEFRVYGEKAAKWLELVMHYDLEVSIDYSEDLVEFWHGRSDRIVDRVSIIEKKKRSSKSLSVEEIRQIKEELLKDPEFIEELHRALHEKD